MNSYTKQEYIAKFGEQMWLDKVEDVNEGKEVESVYATDMGNIFMIINKEEF
jgi:hypothetical protein